MRRQPRLLTCLSATALCLAVGATPMRAQETPLSAIDWLTKSIEDPTSGELPVTGGGALPEEITVAPLDGASIDGLGVLTSARSGLPRTLWSTATHDEVIGRVKTFSKTTLPAVQDAFRLVLLADLDAPANSPDSLPGSLFLTRVDAALDRGDLDAARRLIAVADPAEPGLFRRAFDIALLTGREDAACDRLRTTPGIAPSYAVRVFCLARTGDWRAATITLRTGKALGEIPEAQSALLERFLDLEAFDGAEALPRPRLPSPLEMRIYEAIGEPIATNTLPLAFAHSDLRGTVGWKARIAAAERLAQAGVLSGPRLLEIYGERQPAASGEPWDRVAAVTALQAALEAADTEAIADALPGAIAEMSAANLSHVFAQAVADKLLRADLDGSSREAALRLALLSADYETAARDLLEMGPLSDPELTALARIATGQAPGDTDGLGPELQAIAAAFAAPPAPLPEAWQARLGEGALGLILLDALAILPTGETADQGDVTLGLSLLRRIGLEGTARQAALQYALLADPA